MHSFVHYIASNESFKAFSGTDNLPWYIVKCNISKLDKNSDLAYSKKKKTLHFYCKSYRFLTLEALVPSLVQNVSLVV